MYSRLFNWLCEKFKNYRPAKTVIIERHGGKVVVHPTVILNSNPNGYHVGMPFQTTLLADKPNARIEIGENTRVHGSYIHAWNSITIGRNVLIAAGVNIVDSHGHSSDPKYSFYRNFFHDSPKPIVINDYVWIGMGSTILKGVTVGKCSIVGAGSVVKDDVPDFSIVEGNPAKVVGHISEAEALPEGLSKKELSRYKNYFEYK